MRQAMPMTRMHGCKPSLASRPSLVTADRIDLVAWTSIVDASPSSSSVINASGKTYIGSKLGR